MRVVEPGHAYQIHNADDPDGSIQYIYFVRRRGDDAQRIANGSPGILRSPLSDRTWD